MTHRAWVLGVGFWSSELGDWDAARAVLRNEARAPEQRLPRPATSLLPPNERRRAPDSVAIALEAGSRACAAAGVEPRSIPAVFASTHGDLAVTDYMCETLAQAPAQLSPTRFHNSVHNAPAGYWSIATGSLQNYTALSAGPHTFGAGLLEALVECAGDGQPVLLVAYDVEAKGPLATMSPSTGMLAMALVLGNAPQASAVAALTWEVRQTPSGNAAADAQGPCNAMSACIPLARALATGHPAGIDIGAGHGLALNLALESAEHA